MQRKAILSALPLSAISLAGTALLALTLSFSACTGGGGTKPDDTPSSSSATPYVPPENDTTAAISLEGFNVAPNGIKNNWIDINGSVKAKLSVNSPINKDSIIRLGTTIRSIKFGSNPGGVNFITKEELKDNELVYPDSATAPIEIDLQKALTAHIDLEDESLPCGTYEVFVTVSAWEDKAGKIKKPITQTGTFTKDESYCVVSSSSEEASSSSAQRWTFAEPVDKTFVIKSSTVNIDLDEDGDPDMIVTSETYSVSNNPGDFLSEVNVSSGRSINALRFANIRKLSDVVPNTPIDLHFEENKVGQATDELQDVGSDRYIYVIATDGGKFLVHYIPDAKSDLVLGKNLPITFWKEIE